MYVKRFDEMSEDEKFAIIGALGPREDGILEEIMMNAGPNNEYRIDMSVNGVLVHPELFIARYIESIDELAKRRASVMVRDKFNELTEAFEPIKEVLDRAEKNLAESLGIEKDSWGDY